jgi:hypothetical protein
MWVGAGSVGRLSAQSLDNTGALFFELPMGAQAVGMGQTAVTLEGRGEAAFWNPAGLATINHNEFGLESATLAAGDAQAITAYFPSHRLGVIGGAVYLLDYGDLDRTDATNSVIGRISPRDYEFLVSYATELGSSLTLGINYKVVEFLVDCSGDCQAFPAGQDVAHGVDIGGQLRVGSDGALRLGVAVRNIGFKVQVSSPDQPDPLPARVVVGALYRLALHGDPGPGGSAGAGAGTGAGGNRIDVQFAADLDRPWGNGGESQVRLGLDVGFQHLLRVRGGYAFERAGLSGPSVGMAVSSGTIGVDLARAFLTGADFVADNPTFFSFHVVF